MTPKVAYLIGKLAAAAAATPPTMQGTNVPQTTMRMPMKPPGGPAKPNPKVNPQGGWMNTLKTQRPHMNMNFGAQLNQMPAPGGTQ